MAAILQRFEIATATISYRFANWLRSRKCECSEIERLHFVAEILEAERDEAVSALCRQCNIIDTLGDATPQEINEVREEAAAILAKYPRTEYPK